MMAGMQQTNVRPYGRLENRLGECSQPVDRGSNPFDDDDRFSEGRDGFDAYLERTSISNVEKMKPPHKRDAADLIMENSVYAGSARF